MERRCAARVLPNVVSTAAGWDDSDCGNKQFAALLPDRGVSPDIRSRSTHGVEVGELEVGWGVRDGHPQTSWARHPHCGHGRHGALLDGTTSVSAVQLAAGVYMSAAKLRAAAFRPCRPLASSSQIRRKQEHAGHINFRRSGDMEFGFGYLSGAYASGILLQIPCVRFMKT